MNEGYLRADKCLRRQVAFHIPKKRFIQVANLGHVSSSGEECTFFMEKKPLLYARGMTHLLNNIIFKEAQLLKKQIYAYWGKTTITDVYTKNVFSSLWNKSILRNFSVIGALLIRLYLMNI